MRQIKREGDNELRQESLMALPYGHIRLNTKDRNKSRDDFALWLDQYVAKSSEKWLVSLLCPFSSQTNVATAKSAWGAMEGMQQKP